MVSFGMEIEPARRRIIFALYGAAMHDPPERGHAQKVMRELANSQGFSILDAVPQSMGDQWWFWIEYTEKPKLPHFIKEALWLPVGSYGNDALSPTVEPPIDP